MKRKASLGLSLDGDSQKEDRMLTCGLATTGQFGSGSQLYFEFSGF